MMHPSKRLFALGCLLGILFFSFGTTFARADNVIDLNVNSLLPHAGISFSPSSQTILAGSTFDVSIYLNTYQNSANAIDLTIQFPANLLALVQPSTSNSIISTWTSPPAYSNAAGTLSLIGLIPNGITTGGGLVATLSFRALAAGTATITISKLSSVLANDGNGTQMTTEFGQGTYTITAAAPAGVTVFSVTHPFQSNWYNNNSPTLGWNQDPGVNAFSYVMDHDPFTVPPDAVVTTGTAAAYENLPDGLWYFHIKARQGSVWGATTHFLVRIDTQPPGEFTPTYQILDAANKTVLLSFSTTDELSGVNYYEVGALSNAASSTESPIFIETQSPYVLNLTGPSSSAFTAIVRAVDNAGNVRDESIAIGIPMPLASVAQDNIFPILLAILMIILLIALIHFFFGHRLISRAKRMFSAIEQENRIEKIEEARETLKEAERSSSGGGNAGTA